MSIENRPNLNAAVMAHVEEMKEWPVKKDIADVPPGELRYVDR